MAIVSRRWNPSMSGQGGNAGADCDACNRAAVPQSMGPGRVDWVCEKCGARAPACGDTYGFKACELVKGHEGDHESPSGTCWPSRVEVMLAEPPPPVVPALRRAVARAAVATCGVMAPTSVGLPACCALPAGHEGDHTSIEVQWHRDSAEPRPTYQPPAGGDWD